MTSGVGWPRGNANSRVRLSVTAKRETETQARFIFMSLVLTLALVGRVFIFLSPITNFCILLLKWMEEKLARDVAL